MSAIVVNKSILLGEDFTGNLEEALCAYLNNLIDEELAKGEPLVILVAATIGSTRLIDNIQL